MGLIADYLEEYRERYDDDPCLYISESQATNVKRILEKCKQVQTTPSKEKLRSELLEQYRYIDEIRHKNILREKAVRYILAHNKLESTITIDVFNALLKSIENARQSANILIYEIRSEIYIDTIIKHTSSIMNEESLMIDYVLFSLYRRMSNGASLESSEFRCLVYDCATLMSIHSPMTDSKKTIFKDYITNKYGLTVSNNRCTNCGHHLYNEFRNCLNCYERID